MNYSRGLWLDLFRVCGLGIVPFSLFFNFSFAPFSGEGMKILLAVLVQIRKNEPWRVHYSFVWTIVVLLWHQKFCYGFICRSSLEENNIKFMFWKVPSNSFLILFVTFWVTTITKILSSYFSNGGDGTILWANSTLFQVHYGLDSINFFLI